MHQVASPRNYFFVCFNKASWKLGMENTAQSLLAQQYREHCCSTLFPPDEDNLVWNMFPAVMALNGLEKTGTTSHILAEGSAGEVVQHGNLKSAQKNRM